MPRNLPGETRGPFPADGTGGRDASLNVLDLDGVMRRDIRPAFAGMSGVAGSGVPLEMAIELAEADGRLRAAGRARALPVAMRRARRLFALQPHRRELAARAAGGRRERSGDGSRASCRAATAGALRTCISRSSPNSTPRAPARRRCSSGRLGLPSGPCAAVYADAATYNSSARNLERWPAARDWAFRGDERQALMMLEMAGEPTRGYRGTARISL